MVDLFLQRLNVLKYFPDIDRDLVELAMLPEPTKEEIKKAKRENRPINLELSNLINDLDIKYGIRLGSIGYRTLEQYGDKILDMMLYDKLRGLYGIDITAEDISLFRSGMTNNENLTKISRKLQICNDVFKVSDLADYKFNSICADTIESIIGVMYFQYGLKSVDRIDDWFWSLSPVKESFEQKIHEEEIKRQERLRAYGYFPPYIMHEGSDINDMLEEYLEHGGKGNTRLELQLIQAGNGLYHYYIYNPVFKRRLYVATLKRDDLLGLKDALTSAGIWR
jgi:dsRNA-specific ribonuclease